MPVLRRVHGRELSRRDHRLRKFYLYHQAILRKLIRNIWRRVLWRPEVGLCRKALRVGIEWHTLSWSLGLLRVERRGLHVVINGVDSCRSVRSQADTRLLVVLLYLFSALSSGLVVE